MMDTGGVIRGRRLPIKKLVLWAAAVVVVLGLAVAAGYFYWQLNNIKNNPNLAAQETTQRLVGKVGQLYAVPGDEQPTVAQVQDKEKLKDQSFFNKAENGDYILIYTNNKLALLYREKENKLINVGPVTISDQNAANGDQKAAEESQKP